MDIIDIPDENPVTGEYTFQSSLTGQQIENVLTGVRSVVGVVKRNGENSYSAASASDFGGVEEAPDDGQQYARKNKAWAVVQGGGGQYDELVIPEIVIDGTYHKNDVVIFQNSVYRAKKDNPSTSSLTDWEELNVVNVVHILATPTA